MERKIVSPGELVEILNQEFSKYPEYPQCRFIGIGFTLLEPDETGCNWSDAEVQCSGVSGSSCQAITGRIVAEAKKKYNIK